MGAVVEIWFESLIPFLLKDSHIVQWWLQGGKSRKMQAGNPEKTTIVFQRVICRAHEDLHRGEAF